MKKILIVVFVLIPIISFSQQNKNAITEKVKSGVKKYLYLTMKDYSSYQPVQWSKVEPILSDYLTTDRCKTLLDSVKAIKEPFDFYFTAAKARKEVEDINLDTDSIYQSYVKILVPVLSKMNPLIKIIEKEKSLFKKKVIGYYVYHKYRGKNSYGAYTIGSDGYTLNTFFKVISTDSEEETEN